MFVLPWPLFLHVVHVCGPAGITGDQRRACVVGTDLPGETKEGLPAAPAASQETSGGQREVETGRGRCKGQHNRIAHLSNRNGKKPRTEAWRGFLRFQGPRKATAALHHQDHTWWNSSSASPWSSQLMVQIQLRQREDPIFNPRHFICV